MKETGGKPLTILVVEDDILVRMIATEFLIDMGHTVVEAESAEGALALLEASPVDVIVTDLGLPGMSGMEFVVRAREFQPDIPIVFATGGAGPPVFANDGAATFFLQKPYDGEGISSAIRAVRP